MNADVICQDISVVFGSPIHAIHSGFLPFFPQMWIGYNQLCQAERRVNMGLKTGREILFSL